MLRQAAALLVFTSTSFTCASLPLDDVLLRPTFTPAWDPHIPVFRNGQMCKDESKV